MIFDAQYISAHCELPINLKKLSPLCGYKAESWYLSCMNIMQTKIQNRLKKFYKPKIQQRPNNQDQ